MSYLLAANLGGVAPGIETALIILLFFVLTLSLRAVFRARIVRSGYLLKPLPTEIMAALDAAPPLERPRARKTYRGMPVRWEVTYEAAIVTGLISLRLMLTERSTSYPWVWCNVRKGQYPQLRGLPQHTPLWISGRIKSVQINDIYLQDVLLEFDN